MKIKRIGLILLFLTVIFSFWSCPDTKTKTKTKTETTFTVTFDINGGIGTPPVVQTTDEGSTITLPADTGFSKPAYTFDGWNTNAAGTGTNYNANTSYTVTEDITLYAKWNEITSSGTMVSSWSGLTIPSATTALQHTTLKGKTNVLHIAPVDNNYGWAVLSYSLAAYVNKEITITISVDVWLDIPTKIAWQANLGSNYPVIAGSTSTNVSAGQWHTVTGSHTITVPAGGGTLYLSKDQLVGNPASIGTPAGNVEMYLANFSLHIDDGSEPNEGELTLTIGDKRSIVDMLPEGIPPASVTSWTSSTPAVATVSNGIVTAVNFNDGRGNNTFVSGAATGKSTITAVAGGNTVLEVEVTTTTAGQVGIMDLPPMKDAIGVHFPLVGNIFNPGDVSGSTISNARLTRHYNILTHENHMKPSYLSSGYNANGNGGAGSHTRNTGNFNTANNMINAASTAGIKIVGHTLLWHSQNPSWITNVPTTYPAKEDALKAMRVYITDIVTGFKGKIHIWDVLNEIFPDGVSASENWRNVMRTTGDGQAPNPWYVAIGADFVYEGFLAARLADPDAILYYNDYNTDSVGKATMIRDMVVAVNNKYLASSDKPTGEDANRLLIEGIGMQEHHNLSVQANSIRATLTMFRNMNFTGSNRKIKVSVSELDVLGNANYSAFSSSTGAGTNKHGQSAVTNIQLLTQAERFAQYMIVYLEFTDIIERISLWGVTDNSSWRSGGLPLLFDASGRAKPAYYSFIGALE